MKPEEGSEIGGGAMSVSAYVRGAGQRGNARRLRRRCYLLGLVLAAPWPLFSEVVLAKEGKIFFVAKDGMERQLTASGKDSQPSLSPDSSRVVFIRETDEVVWSEPVRTTATQLWVASTSGFPPARLVLAGPIEIDGVRFAEFFCPQFSPKGGYLYFLINYAATTHAIVRLSLQTGEARFLLAALRYAVVPRGEYEGHLVVQQRRVKLSGGYYYWFWLMSPDGKDIAAIGPDEDDVRMFFELYVDGCVPAFRPGGGVCLDHVGCIEGVPRGLQAP